MKVRIQNYEILGDVKLEFVNGVNIITGESNNGKSAIFRAIEGALFNELGDEFIQFETDYSLVAIQDEDNTVIWRKPRAKNKSTVYTVNGNEMTKVGRTQVAEVANVMDIKEIKLTSTDKEKLNFWVQMEYPFLIGKSGSQLFEFLSLSSENDNLTEVIKEMRSDLGGISKKISKKEGGIDSLKNIIRKEEEYLSTKDGFNVIYDKTLDIESKVVNYKELAQSYSNILTKRGKIAELKESHTNVSESLSIISPKFDEFENDLQDYGKVSQSLSEIDSKTKKIKEEKIRIKTVRETINIIDIIELKLRIDKYIKVEKEIERIKNSLSMIGILSKGIKTGRDKVLNISKRIEERENKLAEFDICPLCGNELCEHE